MSTARNLMACCVARSAATAVAFLAPRLPITTAPVSTERTSAEAARASATRVISANSRDAPRWPLADAGTKRCARWLFMSAPLLLGVPHQVAHLHRGVEHLV